MSSVPSGSRGDRPGLLAAAAQRRKQRQHDLAHASMRSALRPSSYAGAVVWLLALLIALWVLLAVDGIFELHLARHGIRPRSTAGLPAVIWSPFIHVDAAHLLANSLPLVVLGWLILTSGLGLFSAVSGAVIVVGGLADWAFGPSGTSIVGANGLIFGWMGYILARALFARSIRWIAIAVVVVAVFASTFDGLLPSDDHHVFWGGHLLSFVVGVLMGAALHRRPGAHGRFGAPDSATAAKPGP